MKVIHVILAMYVLLLSVLPCSDNDSCIAEENAEIALIDSENDNHPKEEQDLCTPFCICSCCTPHIKLSALADIDFQGDNHNTIVVTPYLEKPSPSDNSHIWQPPRV